MLNTVAARLIQEVTPKEVIRTAQRLGITSALQPNLSLALGTSEVTPLEMTAAYATFANGGQAVLPYVIREVKSLSGKVIYARKGTGFGNSHVGRGGRAGASPIFASSPSTRRHARSGRGSPVGAMRCTASSPRRARRRSRSCGQGSACCAAHHRTVCPASRARRAGRTLEPARQVHGRCGWHCRHGA